MKYPFEKQLDLKDCGVCCLLMLTRYYGGEVSKEYLRSITNTTKDGVSAYSLIDGAKQLGFAAYGVKGDIGKIRDENLPCISHVVINKSYQHFIVIYKINHRKKYLLIADPAKSELVKISFDKYNEITTNQYIFLKPQKKIKYIEKNTVLKKLIYTFVSKNKKSLLFILLLSVLVTIFNILYSFQFKIFMEYVIEYKNTNNLIMLGIIFLGIILIKEFSNYYRDNLLIVLNHQLDKSLFTNVYNHILSLPYLYYKNRTTGEVTARINDLSKVREVMSKLLITLILDSILAIAVLITLFILNTTLTIILVLVIILIVIVMLIFQMPLENRIKKSMETSAKLNSFLVETINGIETIKNQNIQTFIENNFLLKYCKYNKNSYSYNCLYSLEQFLKNIINQCGTFSIMLVGSYLVTQNKLTIAVLITFITLMEYLLEPIKGIVELNLIYKEAKTSFTRISELYEVERENIEKDYRRQLNLQGNIDVKQLTYSYNGRDLFIKNINMNISSGDKVLIYGSSGSGKSTFAKILAKQLEINNGQMFYDGKDINNYSLIKIKEDICYISQQEILFTDSIYNNIVLDKNTDYDQFLDIAKLCMIDEFANKNILTYDMLLEENGFNISGGQRQRIILARAMLKDSKIYILDESLNQVDISKERKILEELFNKYTDKTFIVISHRFHNQDLFTKQYQIEDGVSYEK